MFDDSRPELNGELAFYQQIRPHIKTIFDVGSRDISIFLDFEGEVHYFDPNLNHIDILEKKPRKNHAAYFNNFALGNQEGQAYYYPRFESFHDRIYSCYTTDEHNKVLFDIKRADEYIRQKGVESIDFLKIDTEGHEFSVLKGFGEELKRVNIIQFEYGGCWMDSHIRLEDVLGYLMERGFESFYYLSQEGDLLVPITDTKDHYKYCNIICKRASEAST